MLLMLFFYVPCFMCPGVSTYNVASWKIDGEVPKKADAVCRELKKEEGLTNDEEEEIMK